MKFWISQNATLLIALASVLVSLTAACLVYNASEDNTRAQYVTLAITILRAAPTSQPDSDLHDWATEVFQKYAKIKLSPEIIANLRSGKLKLPSIVGSGAITESSDIVRGQGTVTR